MNKSKLREILISNFDNILVPWRFEKFNNRLYFFSRKNEEIFDYIKIQVNLNKGSLWCFLVSNKSKIMTESYIFNDERTLGEYLINSRMKSENFPSNINYNFENTYESFQSACENLITDLSSDGEAFFKNAHSIIRK